MGEWGNISAQDVQPSFNTAELSNDPKVHPVHVCVACPLLQYSVIDLCRLILIYSSEAIVSFTPIALYYPRPPPPPPPTTQSAVVLESCDVDTSTAYYNGGCFRITGHVRTISGVSKPAVVRWVWPGHLMYHQLRGILAISV